MKERTKKRLEKIKGIMELAEKRHLSMSIQMTIHSTSDPEAVKECKKILRGMRKEFDGNFDREHPVRWLRFHDGKGAQDYLSAGFYINIFCPRDTK